MSVTTQWLEQLGRAPSVGSHVALLGGADDVVVLDGEVRNADFAMAAVLRRAGLEHVLQFQLAHGFVDGDARDAAEALLGEAAAAGERHPGNLNSTNPLASWKRRSLMPSPIFRGA